jgi:hypothetical protein
MATGHATFEIEAPTGRRGTRPSKELSPGRPVRTGKGQTSGDATRQLGSTRADRNRLDTSRPVLTTDHRLHTIKSFVRQAAPEFSWPMACRIFLKRGISFCSALALLVTVMASPVRPPSLVGSDSLPNHFQRDFAPPHPSRHAVSPVALRIIKAVRAEREQEELRKAPSCVLYAPEPPRNYPANPSLSGPVLPTSSSAPTPLRC